VGHEIEFRDQIISIIEETGETVEKRTKLNLTRRFPGRNLRKEFLPYAYSTTTHSMFGSDA
jgi:hypothetical protein